MYTPEQQKENRKKWIEALRSGEYKQTSAALVDPYGYCCLGVACNISGLGHWEQREGNHFQHYKCVTNNDYVDYAYGDLPLKVMHWLGLDSLVGDYEDSDLITNNDVDDLSFEQIADIIEEEPEGLLRE